MIRTMFSAAALALGLAVSAKAQSPSQLLVCRDGRVTSTARMGRRACDRDGGINERATLEARRNAEYNAGRYENGGIYNGNGAIYGPTTNRGVYEGNGTVYGYPNGTNRGVYNGATVNGSTRSVYGSTTTTGTNRSIYNGTVNGTVNGTATPRVYRDDDARAREKARDRKHGDRD